MLNLTAGLVLLAGLMALGGCGAKQVRNGIGMEFVYIPAGSFQMGAATGGPLTQPVHQVTIANGFSIGKYEVTQAQWQKVMGGSVYFDNLCGDNCPADKVSWNDAQEFITKLNAMNDGYIYRLPSEAEWEYACRAGITSDDSGDLNAVAWYDKNAGGRAHPVGKKQANAWGLYDMRGNVWEWCEDINHDNYRDAPADGSVWASGGDAGLRVMRGGSWGQLANSVTSASRYRLAPNQRGNSGFRLVAVAKS